MVGGFLYDAPDALAQEALRAAGADDSKALSHRRRVAVRAGLDALGGPHSRSIPPSAIDDGNLNALEIDAFLDIVAACQPDHVFLDAPVHPRGIPRLQADLIRRSGVQRWTIEPKADSTYPVVGAASIVAKVLRDATIEQLRADSEAAGLGAIGSGYPSDPLTRAWLQGFLTRGEPFPDSVRTRWGTIEALKQAPLFPG